MCGLTKLCDYFELALASNSNGHDVTMNSAEIGSQAIDGDISQGVLIWHPKLHVHFFRSASFCQLHFGRQKAFRGIRLHAEIDSTPACRSLSDLNWFPGGSPFTRKPRAKYNLS